MLRKRSRAVASKQAIIGDHSNQQQQWPQPDKPTKPTSSFFFNSPRIFKGFFTFSSSPISSPETTEPVMSPASILDTKPFSALANSLWAENKKIPTTTTAKTLSHSWEQPSNTKGIGVALVDDNSENNSNLLSKQQQHKRKLVVFGSQLRIQVPPLPPSSVFPCFSPESSSPREFGIKTPRSNLRPFCNRVSTQIHPQENVEMVKDDISMIDMEQSEDYTCVISHGPNPKTTHIFGNCIVESCCGVRRSSSKRNGFMSPLASPVPSQEDDFLSFCHHCKKKLGQGKDIYMYRGEKAFCSQECRCQGMLFDGVES